MNGRGENGTTGVGGGGERTRRKNPRPHREGKYREVPRDVWRKEKRRRFCETEEANETRSAAKRSL